MYFTGQSLPTGFANQLSSASCGSTGYPAVDHSCVTERASEGRTGSIPKFQLQGHMAQHGLTSCDSHFMDISQTRQFCDNCEAHIESVSNDSDTALILMTGFACKLVNHIRNHVDLPPREAHDRIVSPFCHLACCMLKGLRLPSACVVLSAVLMQRAISVSGFTITVETWPSCTVACFIVAAKMTFDEGVWNADFAEVSCRSTGSTV